ncbi:MAG: tRNA guanosine(34) transglycosylase Tgt [Acidobacteria bacterium]|nr:tRNA guanosine(34) transglycosylase Tgt [Acidobacteriota bacterium]
MKPIHWKIEATDGKARAGTIVTRRSVIETPVFMPVGTQGAVKGIRFEWLEDELDARIILGNTYHLFLRPGVDIINRFGGLHKFTSWNRAMLTDSGGFQVFSLTDLRKLNEDGVEFRSHLDGSKKILSPEVSMEIQAALGSEIVMVFDECPPGDAGYDATKTSLELTARWAARSKARFNDVQSASFSLSPASEEQAEACTLNGKQALFGIIQGAGHLDLRRESLDRTVEIGFDGYAIGGLSVGEEKVVMYEVLDQIAHQMPNDAPRYLMGVGTPEDLVEAVNAGVDIFDCVIPTRNGRTGSAFTSRGKVNIRNAKFSTDTGPLDPNCECSVCKRYSLGYLRHLNNAGEMTAATLISHHNVAFFLSTMRKAREAILESRFPAFRKDFLSGLHENNAEGV